MAQYKVCRSTRSIARIDVFPEGATTPISLEVYKGSFHETISYCEIMTERIAQVFCYDFEQLERLLSCFGLYWERAEDWEDASEALSQDYESRKERLETLV